MEHILQRLLGRNVCQVYLYWLSVTFMVFPCMTEVGSLEMTFPRILCQQLKVLMKFRRRKQDRVYSSPIRNGDSLTRISAVAFLRFAIRPRSCIFTSRFMWFPDSLQLPLILQPFQQCEMTILDHFLFRLPMIDFFFSD